MLNIVVLLVFVYITIGMSLFGGGSTRLDSRCVFNDAVPSHTLIDDAVPDSALTADAVPSQPS